MQYIAPTEIEVAHLAGRHRGQGLVEQRHPGVDVARRHEVQAALAHRVEDEVGVAVPPRDLDGGGEVLFAGRRVGGDGRPG